MNVSLLQRIFQEMDNMGAAERRIANFVNASPGEVIHMSMAKLAETCSVSDPRGTDKPAEFRESSVRRRQCQSTVASFDNVRLAAARRMHRDGFAFQSADLESKHEP